MGISGGDYDITTTSGGTKHPDQDEGASDEKMYLRGPINNDDYGIVVGTSNAAIDLTDYALTSQCTEGVGANQLNHGATGFVAPATDGTSRIFEVFRTFSNNSGAGVDVEEVGLYCLITTQNPGSVSYFMLERTLLSFTIADTDTDTVRYTISVVV